HVLPKTSPAATHTSHLPLSSLTHRARRDDNRYDVTLLRIGPLRCNIVAVRIGAPGPRRARDSGHRLAITSTSVPNGTHRAQWEQGVGCATAATPPWPRGAAPGKREGTNPN